MHYKVTGFAVLERTVECYFLILMLCVMIIFKGRTIFNISHISKFLHFLKPSRFWQASNFYWIESLIFGIFVMEMIVDNEVFP